MSNTYTQGCTYISARRLPHREKILKAWRVMTERDQPEKAFDLEDWCGLDIEAADDGGLYISSGAEWFNEGLFQHFIGLMLKNGWIDANSIDFSGSYFCDKLRPGEFGGFHVRVTKTGNLIGFSTGSLESLTDDQLTQIEHYVNHPHDLSAEIPGLS